MTTTEATDPGGLDSDDPIVVVRAAAKALRNASRDFNRRTVIFAVAIAVLTIAASVMGVTAYRNAHSVREARHEAAAAASSLAEFKHNIKVAQKSSCRQANTQADRDRAAFIDNALVLIQVAARSNPTPEEQATVAAYLAAQRSTAVKDFPYRRCTAAGIAKFLNQSPPNP